MMHTFQRLHLPQIRERLLADGARCDICPLAQNGRPRNPVPSQWGGVGSPAFALVGEAPGRMEVRSGVPFIGPAGKVLAYACKQGGVPRAQAAVLNAAACGPIMSGDEHTKQAATAACRPRLITELKRLRPKVIVALGAYALRVLAPQAPSGVTVLRGALIKIAEDIWWEEDSTARLETRSMKHRVQPLLTCSYHPSHILRGGDGDAPGEDQAQSQAVDLLFYFLIYDLAKAYQLAIGRARPWTDECDLFAFDGRLHRVTVDHEGAAVAGDSAHADELVAAVTRVYDEARKHRRFSCDVETDSKDALAANLTAIAVATVDGGLSATWAAWQAVPRALEILRRLLAHPLLHSLFHNRAYDTVVLPRHGLPVGGPVDDSLLLHHAAFPGLPHKLDQVAQQLCCVPAWKDEFRKGMKDEAPLVLYNFRDAAITALIEAPLCSLVKARKTEKVYETDRQLAAVATAMQVTGVWIDRIEQARHSRIQHARLDYMRGQLEAGFRAIEHGWRVVLARNLAAKPRKKDPTDYGERVKLRWREIEKRGAKPTDVGLLKVTAKADIVALFETLQIPFSGYTKKGAPITDKSAMEAAALRHPLMRGLIHVKEAQNLIASVIDGLPVKDDGRLHHNWNIAKITGRWSAGKAQNITKFAQGWPPAVDASGDFKRKPRWGEDPSKPTGDFVTPTENMRSHLAAPTTDEVLSQGLVGGVQPLILERALEGHGRMLFGADMEQLELRIAAQLGKDQFLLNIFERGLDPHAEFAREAFPQFAGIEEKLTAVATRFGTKMKKVAKLDYDRAGEVAKLLPGIEAELLAETKVLATSWSKLRDVTKRGEYGGIYGASADTVHAALVKDYPDTTLQGAQKLLAVVNQKMSGVVAWRNRMEIAARTKREIREAILGRVRMFPLGNFNASVVYNFPIQCGKFDQRVMTTSGWVQYQHLDPKTHALVQHAGVTQRYTVRSTGAQPCFRLRTQGRRATITAEHHFLAYVAGDQVAWLPLKEIRVGDWLVVREAEAPQDDAKPISGVGEPEAELIGALFGNGSYSGRGCAISTGSRGYADHIERIAAAAQPFNVNRRRAPGTYVVAIDAIGIQGILHEWGLPIAAGRAKRLPTWAETAPRFIQRALLRGLFDTDGGFGGRYLSFTTAESVNARVVERLLLAQGIDVRLLPFWSTTPAGERRPYWRVRVMPWSVQRFREVIGFRHPERAKLLATRKLATARRPLPPDLASFLGEQLRARLMPLGRRALKWTAKQHARLHRLCAGSASVEQVRRIAADAAACGVDVADVLRPLDWRFERVEAITRSRPAETYDIAIDEEDHGYVVEGLVTHNSFAASLVALAIFRFVALTRPSLLQLDRLSAFGLLDLAWVDARREAGFGAWNAPVDLLLNGHDSLVGECDEEDAEKARNLLGLAMSQTITLDGVKMVYPAEPKLGRRVSEV